MSELIDNRSLRIETLKHIIQHLHRGEAPDAVRAQLRELVHQTDATEIMAMEQDLIASGMPVEEVRSMLRLAFSGDARCSRAVASGADPARSSS